jgi:hypothetical protein
MLGKEMLILRTSVGMQAAVVVVQEDNIQERAGPLIYARGNKLRAVSSSSPDGGLQNLDALN